MKKDFVYLASASPRRRELLAQIGVPFEVRPAAISESRAPGEAPEDYVLRMAMTKAETVWGDIALGQRRAVVGADTAVVVDGSVLGKPAGSDDALAMLDTLSGRTHVVMTGVSVVHSGGSVGEVSSSEVSFRPTTARERRAYVASGEPMDKAGGYAIQGLGAVFIEHLSGSYSGVVGLPLALTVSLLTGIGLPAWLSNGEDAA
ncbi:MAG TPA: Maf family protein [Gammaproteobacteria bacterium]